MDIQAFAPHVVFHFSDMSDPYSYVELGKYINFGLGLNHSSVGTAKGNSEVAQLTEQCLLEAKKVMENTNDDEIYVTYEYDGSTVSMGQVKRDLLALISAEIEV